MPIYEYQCKECGHELEIMQRMSDPLLTDCPACGKAALKKLVSAAAFQLKGTGWYVTDFRDKGKKAAEKKGDSEGAAGKEGEGKSDTKADKPEKSEPSEKSAKTESKPEKKAAAGSD